MSSKQIWARWLCKQRGHKWTRISQHSNFRTCKTCGDPGWEV